jgi:DNA-binding LacI/PurR family transcriptional regulator
MARTLPPRPQGRVGIAQVAAEAGVSTATASRVLSKTGYASELARQRVSVAAERLQYQPDATARALRRRRSTTIGILVPDLTNPVNLSFIRGVQHVAQPCGYAVMIGDAQRDRDIERRQIELFESQRVAGVLVAGQLQDDEALEGWDPESPLIHTPLSLEVGTEGENPAVDELGADLARHGHERVLFVSRAPVDARPGPPRTERRFRALSRAATRHGIAVDRCSTPAELSADRTALQLQPKLKGRDAATALVCASHRLAPQLLGTLSLMKINIPTDLSFVTFGDSEWAQAYRPSIAVIRFDRYTEARRATFDLLKTLGSTPDYEEPPAPPVYMARGSICPAPEVRRH